MLKLNSGFAVSFAYIPLLASFIIPLIFLFHGSIFHFAGVCPPGILLESMNNVIYKAADVWNDCFSFLEGSILIFNSLLNFFFNSE